MKHKTPIYLILAALLTGIALGAAPQRQVEAQTPGRYYPATGKTLAPEFLSFFDTNGGLPIFGYPLTDAETEGGFEVQYLERARIEYHPENRGTPYEVQLGLLGNILTAGRRFEPASSVAAAEATPGSGKLYFSETQHTLSGAFLQYWQAHGGLALFGYPISEAVQEGGVTAQYFQRNRFELHPENAGTPYEVQLGLLGRDLLTQRVQVSESKVTLPTYGYEQGFVSSPGDTIAPYPRLDMARVGPAAPRTYRLIVLENKYLKLSVMPQLGGRLYEVIYKPTGNDELYRNPVIKPSTFGERGWWLAVGGMEWAAPTEEHGLMEYLPWDATVARNSDGGATATMSATDARTGLKVTGSITLSPEESSYRVQEQIENHTAQQQSAQLWTNAMLTPGGTNQASPDTRFILPTSRFVVHSTSDSALPAPHVAVTWPNYGGRDLSDMSTWRGWLGGFALPGADRGTFAAVYNPQADEGMVKTFKPGTGLKIFGFGRGFNSRIYTDDNSSYAELWGGITPTFWDNVAIAPGASMSLDEQWQPVSGLGGVSLASKWGAISLSNSAIYILPARRTEGAIIVLHKTDGEVIRQSFNAYPDKAASVQVSGSVASVEITSADGQSLLSGELAAR